MHAVLETVTGKKRVDWILINEDNPIHVEHDVWNKGAVQARVPSLTIFTNPMLAKAGASAKHAASRKVGPAEIFRDVRARLGSREGEKIPGWPSVVKVQNRYHA
eukprot:CAMPEP_0172630172 /NCGR_PEP_ID=MMETSP1068-20121228/172337_1 /TAXON_ID=35684 /ORGANISM="Pseudopedinella elastica, Strain CCMP716" /LENGTH=103 /DNA_ID=CAMNT_0013440953 /DNA_START=592 /DNA_END=903 /DNA_ORIENTATION=-